MKINQDYIGLKKTISHYIDKYPSSNKQSNQVMLERLHELKPLIATSPKASKEYYKIRNNLTLSNGGFAMSYVMKYNNLLNDDACTSELFQEATIGIIESIDTFDLTKNTSFTTYAYYHVRKRIIDYIKKNKLIKAPRDIARNIKHVSEAQEKLTALNGKIPSIEDIRKYLVKNKKIFIKDDIISNILILLELNSAGTDDTFITEYTDQVSIEDKESTLFRNLELNILSEIQLFPERKQKIIKYRFGIGEDHPHSIEEIKLMLNTTDKELGEIK